MIGKPAILAVVLFCTSIVWWLKAEHNPSVPIGVAQAFIAHLEMKQFAQAYELTTKNGYVGTTAAEFEDISRRQICNVARAVSTSPFQSNGNRLRRWVSGAPVEMPEVRVEFEGACLLGITLRYTESNEWRVSKFASHAG